MCILLKLHYAKFDVSSLFCSKVIEEKPLGCWLYPPPPPGKGKVKSFAISLITSLWLKIFLKPKESRFLAYSTRDGFLITTNN